ncbi:MAG: 23S rRNA (uracil(1939)-C(5))-methyltransferase RlmD, partial [Clostridium sp.]
GKKDFGKKEYGKKEYGKNDSGKREYGKSDSGKREYGKNDSGKREYGKSDSGKREYGRKETGRSESGKRTPGKSDSGRSASGRSASGRREFGKKDSGKPGSGKDGPGELNPDYDAKIENKNERSTGKLCPVYKQCGGCQLLHLPYRKQLEQKQQMMEELLGGLCTVKPIIGMKDPFHYRNKVHAVFDHDKRGQALSGVYKEGTHLLIPVERCMIEDEKADEIIGTIRGMLHSFKILTYDEDTGYGFFRHVLVKRGFATGEIMVVLVTASPIFPSKSNFVKALLAKHPEITTIIQNVNDRITNMVLGNKEHVLYGKGYIEDELCGYRFRISSRSFYQVNPIQAEVLYKKVLELAKLTGKETVLDAYCGVGTIGMFLSKYAAQVIGVELNKDAMNDAVQNAKQNDVKNIQFYCNDAGKFMTDMAGRGEKVDVVIMDPPRSGSTKEFIDAVALMGPDRVVYVSCGPESLERDLRMFKDKGYRGSEAWPVDMFPETKHVEAIILMTYCGDKPKK